MGPRSASRSEPLSEPGPASAWANTPLSWSKLAEIERWLKGPALAAPAEQVTEARLELAEGLEAFTRRDAQVASASVLEGRRQRANGLFRQVIDDTQSTPAQRTRAEQGLRSLSGAPITASAPAPAKEMGFVPRARWGAQAALPARMTRAAPPWTRITVHHTAMEAQHLRSGGLDSSAEELRQIQKNHIHSEGWGDIGYHFLIDPSGRVFEGRQLAWQGAHAGGANNEHNIGICLLGNFQVERPTREALQSLERLIGDLSKRHRIPRRQVLGHQDLKTTECPGVHLYSWLRAYKSGAANSSRIVSTDHLGHQPSDCSLCASPTISSGSEARANAGSNAVE